MSRVSDSHVVDTESAKRATKKGLKPHLGLVAGVCLTKINQSRDRDELDTGLRIHLMPRQSILERAARLRNRVTAPPQARHAPAHTLANDNDDFRRKLEAVSMGRPSTQPSLFHSRELHATGASQSTRRESATQPQPRPIPQPHPRPQAAPRPYVQANEAHDHQNGSATALKSRDSGGGTAFDPTELLPPALQLDPELEQRVRNRILRNFRDFVRQNNRKANRTDTQRRALPKGFGDIFTDKVFFRKFIVAQLRSSQAPVCIARAAAARP